MMDISAWPFTASRNKGHPIDQGGRHLGSTQLLSIVGEKDIKQGEQIGLASPHSFGVIPLAAHAHGHASKHHHNQL